MAGIDPISIALDIGGKIIDKIWPDPAQKAQAQLELFKLQQSGELAQMTAETQLAQAQAAVNQAEAANANLFVAGWRPWIGWVCGSGLAYQYLAAPLLTWFASLIGHPTTAPSLDIATLMQLLFGMLGLGAMRTVEKLNGKA